MTFVKKIIFSTLSVLGFSFCIWILLMLNPRFVYSNSTQIDQVRVYHDTALDFEAEKILKDALNIVSTSSIYDDQIQISLCMNDHAFYPKLYAFAGGTAYAFLDKTVIYNSEPNFSQNTAEFTWEINNYETRKFDLTILLAHEFMHNLQYNYDSKYQIFSTLGKLNWKLEGHAEYVARGFKNDGQLIKKIDNFLFQEKQEHIGIPVFKIENGTIQNLSYYKYALLIQYLMEEKKLSYLEICELETDKSDLYSEMINWRQSSN